MNILIGILMIQILGSLYLAKKKGVKPALVLYAGLAITVSAFSLFTSDLGAPLTVAKAEAIGLGLFLLVIADLLGLKQVK